jgi:hypothetical protein
LEDDEMLSETFARYLKAAYPDEAISNQQHTEVQRAFYAGAWAVLCMMAPSETNALGLRGMVGEALQFNEDVRAGIK